MTCSLNSDTLENILIVDDTPANLRLLSAALTERGYEVRSALNGEIALMEARSAIPDLILLDILMPGMNGYEVCQQLKADPLTRRIPVIFLSALDETFDKVRQGQPFKVVCARKVKVPRNFSDIKLIE